MTEPSTDERPYRRGVGAVLLNADGLVFAARRIDTPDESWQLPQGCIDEGEDPEQTVLRELEEEIGTAKATIIGQTDGWLRYDLPMDLSHKVWKGRFRGQEQKWFVLRFTGTDSDIDLDFHDSPEFDAWKWMAFEDLPEMIVPFKRRLYEDIVAAFRHLAVPQMPQDG